MLWETTISTFFKYVISKRKTRDNIGLLFDNAGHLTNMDLDTIMIFLNSVFNTESWKAFHRHLNRLEGWEITNWMNFNKNKY